MLPVSFSNIMLIFFLSKKLKVSLYLKKEKKNVPKRVSEDQFFSMGLYSLAV